MRRLAPGLALLLALGGAPARGAGDLESPRQSWLIDHTRSQLGGEFFRAFADAWRREPRGALVIAVEEQMGRLYAHQITIRVGSRTLLETRFYPGQRDDIARLAEASASTAATRLAGIEAGSGDLL